MEFGDSPKLTPEYFLRLLALQRRQEDEAAVTPRPVSREVSDIAELGQTAQRPYYKNPDPGYSHQQDAIESQRRAAEYESQADQPMERPRGLKENAVSGIRAFIEGMAQPKSPFAGIERREDQYASSKAQTLARAKELRAQAMQQQQIGRGVSADAAEGERHAQTMDFNKKRQSFDEEVANRPRPYSETPGEEYGVIDPKTGVRTKQGSVPKPPTAGERSNLSEKTVRLNDESFGTDVLEDRDPSSPTFGRIFLQTAEGMKDVTGQQKHYESPAKYSEPFQSFYDPNQGENVLARRSDVPNFSTAAQSPNVLQAVREAKDAAGRIGSLRSLYKPEFVGPDVGRVNKLKSLVPEWTPIVGGKLPEGWAQFSAADAELKNDVIKAITGAQMNKNEEARIISQIPTGNDRPEMWEAKYDRTNRRVQVIQLLLDRQIGASNYTVDQIDAMVEGRMPIPGSSATATPTGGGRGGGPAAPTGATGGARRVRIN